MTEHVNEDNLETSGQNYETLSYLYELQFLLERMLRNAQQLQNENSGNIVTVSNTNLYVLADKYYGDPRQWTLIAEANGITDPQIIGITNIIIPKFDGVVRNGIYDDDQ